MTMPIQSRTRSPFSRRIELGLVAALLLLCSACGSATRVTRVEPTMVTDFSGRWNDTDSRAVAETRVSEAVKYPWLETYRRAKGRAPVVVGSIANRSHEHVNMHTLVADLERALTNSQQILFVAGKGEREELREERREQAVYAREDTQKSAGKEIGADFLLRGSFSSILDESGGTKAIFYQVDLELVDLEGNVKAWFGQHKIKKILERRQTMF